MAIKVLIAEDEQGMRQILMMLLKDFPFEFYEASNGKEAKLLLEQESFGLIILDLKLPFIDGIELLKLIKEKEPEIPVVVITAYGSIEGAVEAIRLGAFDYVTKPFEEERLLSCINKAYQISKLLFEVKYLRKEIEERYKFDKIIAISKEMCHVLKLAGEVAETDTTVTITGESGTGKELISRAIHFNSKRSSGPFLALNCAAIPPTLLEAELFGFEKGAFTGATRRKRGKLEIASGGTIFLDEIGDMAIDVQARLLRVIEEQQFQRLGGTKTIKVNVRIIAATNKNLAALVKDKKFREDLYYRINVFPIHIPPLREHKEDIPLLCEHFIKKYSKAFGRKPPAISKKALNRLMEHDWPGNIRELKNVIERAMIMCKSNQITTQHIILHESTYSEERVDTRDIDKLSSLLLKDNGIDIVQLEVGLIKQALKITNNNISKAARLLGLSRPTLRYRIEKYGLSK